MVEAMIYIFLRLDFIPRIRYTSDMKKLVEKVSFLINKELRKEINQQAKAQKTTPGALMRQALEERFFWDSGMERRHKALEALISMNAPVPASVKELNAIIADARAAAILPYDS